MRNRLQLLIVPILLAAQVATTVPVHATASQAPAAPTVGTNPVLQLDINSPDPVVTPAVTQPDFDTDVLVPLRAQQAAAAAAAQAAALAAAKTKRVVHRTVRVVTVASGDVWGSLRMCESGGNYARNSGNGYYGAYQYNLGTWSNFGGYARPDLAPPTVQDEKARQTQAARGWSPWPTCARKLGLL